jgi:hypothetical protein
MLIRSTRFAAVVAATALTLCSCKQNVGLADVATLDKTVVQTQAAFASISDDYRASCVRTASWQRAAEPDTLPNVLNYCSEASRAARQWQAANSIVTSYVAALAALAGGNSDAGDYGLGAFFDAFDGLGVTKSFTPAQQKAVASAASSLVGSYYQAKRRDALAPIIASADVQLGSLVSTLEDIARTNYVAQLRTERLALQLFFEPQIAQAEYRSLGSQAFMLRASEREEQHAVDERQAAVTPYVAALENIRLTHAQLARSISDNRLADVDSIVRDYLAAYEPPLAALQKAYK